MDHLQRSRLNLLTSHMLDRGGLLRLDPALIAEQAADQRARFLGIRHMRIAVDRSIVAKRRVVRAQVVRA